MKKKRGVERAVSILSIKELESLHTKALLARLQRLRFCEPSPEGSDLTDDDISTVSDKILFKSDTAWEEAYKDLKNVLATREHVPNKPR